jgi:ribosomal protein L7/L12
MNDRWLEDLNRKLDLLLNKFEINHETPPMPENLGQIARVAANGNKIEAIKLYRQQTGASLEEAKNFVDKRDWNMPTYALIDYKMGLLLNKFEISLPQSAAEEGYYRAITAFLRLRNKVEAIKVYREHTGVGLKEAKDAVDAIEKELR